MRARDRISDVLSVQYQLLCISLLSSMFIHSKYCFAFFRKETELPVCSYAAFLTEAEREW